MRWQMEVRDGRGKTALWEWTTCTIVDEGTGFAQRYYMDEAQQYVDQAIRRGYSVGPVTKVEEEEVA